MESKVNKGTDVPVYLPADLEKGAASASLPADLPRGCGESILVVDDEEGILNLCQRILENNGYRVILASEGAKALEVFRQSYSQISVVFTDIMMPRMNGVTLVRNLRKICPGVKVIASTGLGSDPLVAAASELGVSALLRKPFNLHTLLRTIRNVLDEAVISTGESSRESARGESATDGR